MTKDTHIQSHEIYHQSVPLPDVMRYFAQTFQMPADKELINWDYYVDTAKQKVIFELHIESKRNPNGNQPSES